MKKVIIALLVVLSVFALVSCSSNTEPTVKTENVTLSNANVGVSNVWSTKLAHNTSKYCVWYLDASGKYIDITTNAMTLKNSAGEAIGTLQATVTAVAKEGTVSGSATTGDIVYAYDEVKLTATADDNVGEWKGEVVVATKAVSDTQLSGIVAKYAVTYTRTKEVGAPLDFGNIKLAVGGNNTEYTVDRDDLPGLYEVLDSTKTYANVQKVYVSLEKLKESLKGKTPGELAIFEQLDGGYVYVDSVIPGSATPPAITIDDAADDEKLGNVYLLTSEYSGSGATAGVIFGFVLDDLRGDSYKQFVDYDYSAKFVLACAKINEKGKKVIDGDIIANASITGDLEPRKTFKVAQPYGEPASTKFDKVIVGGTNEHAGLFYINTKDKYIDLQEYYIGGNLKSEPLAIGKVVVTESYAGEFERNLNVQFMREDAPGEQDPDMKAMGTLSETLKVYLCSYTDKEDQKTIKPIANFDMYFENEKAGDFTIVGSNESGKSVSANYYMREEVQADGTKERVEDISQVYVWNTWDAAAPVWEKLTASNNNYSVEVVLGTSKEVATLTVGNLSSSVDPQHDIAVFSIISNYSGTTSINDVIYVKFVRVEIDEAGEVTTLKDSDSPAVSKLAIDCTLLKN